MIQALILLALGSTQNDTIYRNDPDRPAYQAAVDTCAEVEKLLPAQPEAAIEKLGPVFADIEKGTLKLVEQQIFIETKAQETRKHEFYPYHLRGRARLLAARKRKDEEARRLLIGAAGDLQTSVTRNAKQSADPLAQARKDLWENVRAALTYEEGWKRDRAGLTDQALALIAATDLSKEAAEWLAGEIGRMETRLRDLRRTVPDLEARRAPAAQFADWCETLGPAAKSFPAVQAAALKAGALAIAIRDSKGTFRLKIGVSPWAKVERLERPGEVIALADRDTPLVVPQELEIDTYTIELVHPKGRKNFSLRANSLQPGRTYVLWGDMSGDELKVSELLK